jgi:WD40 repeat protein
MTDMDRRRSALRGRPEGRRRPARRIDARWWGLAMLIAVLSAGPVRAQDEVANFNTPILMVETGGHHARVRSLVWQDDRTLLSGGEDKVVKVWDFHEAPRLARSIRPMIWRGIVGSIYAMAVSPRPDAQGQSFLAVAGFGTETRGGDITVFRIPGLVRTSAGEVVARMFPPPDGQPQATGHQGVVTCLAFDPTGKILASGSADRTIILWDVPGFQPRPVVLSGHTGGIRAIAFSPDGSRLASGGADGSLRTWDVARGVQVDVRPAAQPVGNPINSLAYSPDGETIVAGREAPGRLNVYQAANLAVALPPLPMENTQGPVECLAFHRDAAGRTRLAVSIKSDNKEVPDPIGMMCDVEIRNMPGGGLDIRRQVNGLVYALAFSPDGRRLAYAGGTSQAIQLADPAAPQRPPTEIRGAGSTPFDVRFSADGKVVGFTREAFLPANPPAIYEGFDLERREPANRPRNELTGGAIEQFQGWTLRRAVGSPLAIEAFTADGQLRRFTINQAQERQAWSWTFIPGMAGHPRTTVAIGTETSVAIFNLDTGKRTRVYSGHSSPVVSLAASPDGRWLASSSLDQTILLYPLDGCDERAPLGVEFQPQGPGDPWKVASVEPRSFAAAMGMRPDDVIVLVGVASAAGGEEYFYDDERIKDKRDKDKRIKDFFDTLPDREPYLVKIGFRVRRTISIPIVGPVPVDLVLPTTRRHSPAMALFQGTDREWVLWTPQGYYDTSIEGDARFLGWHINPPFRTSLPTDFVPVGTFAEAMNRRDILDRLWRTGVLDAAANPPVPAPVGVPVAEVRPPAVVAVEDQPPRIAFAPVGGDALLPAPGLVWEVAQPNVQVELRLSATGASPISRRRIILDERVLPLNPNLAPAPAFNERVPLAGLVPKRPVRLAVEAANAAGGLRTETIDIVYVPPAAPPAPPPNPPRLHVMAIGSDRFASGLPAVEFAVEDARELARWLAEHLTSADGDRVAAERPRILVGEDASTRSIAGACDHLRKLVDKKQVNEHDIVTIVIASHLLATPQGVAIAAADTVAGDPTRPAFPAANFAEVLGQLADYGCRVVVFLDGVHKLDEPSKSEIKSFVRDLQRKRGVITFIASKEGPSYADRFKGHGVFAQGVMQVFEGADLAGARKDRAEPVTLDQFRTSLKNEVSNLSGRKQQAECYLPTRVNERTLFARPKN